MNLLGDETFQRGDKIPTLSTCTDYDHRLVVQGRLKERIPYPSRQTNERDQGDPIFSLMHVYHESVRVFERAFFVLLRSSMSNGTEKRKKF